jgi:PAS domain S-box-containing protein
LETLHPDTQPVAPSAAAAAIVIMAEISEALNANQPLDTLLSRIVHAVKQLVNCDACSIGLIDKERRYLHLRAAVEPENVARRVGLKMQIDEFKTLKYILDQHDLLYLPNCDESPLWRPDYPNGYTGALAFIGIPLISQDAVIGMLLVDFYRTNPMYEDMRYTLLALSRLASAALQSANIQEELRTAESRYHLIADMTSEAVYEYTEGASDILWSEGIDRLMHTPTGKFPRTRSAWVETIHPDDIERVLVALDHALSVGSVFKEEYRVRRSDGAYLVVLDRAARFESQQSSGWVSRIIGSVSDMTQTYELADALLDSETRYRTVFERALDAIFVMDSQGNFIDVNPAAEILTGYNYAKLLSMSVQDLAVPHESADYMNIFEQLREDGEVSVREMKLFRHDQTLMHVEIWGTALGDNIFQLVARDVTLRVTAEKQSQQRVAELMALNDVTRVTTAGGDLNEMLRRVLPEAMNTLDAGLGCIYLREGNTSTLRLIAQVGYSQTAMPSRVLPLSAANRGRSAEGSSLVRIVDHGALSSTRGMDVSLQVPLVSNDRVLGLVIFSGSASRAFTQTDIHLMDIIGRQLGIGIENVRLLDNLEQLVLERTTALSAAEARYRSLIEQVPGVVYTADAIYRGLSFVSSGTESLFGLTSDELLKRNSLLKLINADDVAWMRERAEQTMSAGRDFDCQYRVIHNTSGSERWVHHRARLILAETGETFWLGLLTDVTELKELDSLKNQFVSTVTHELRTPLTAIKLRAATLNNYYARLTDEQRLDAVRRISYQSDILAKLIEDVLRLAKLDAGTVERQIDSLEVIGIAQTVVDELRPSSDAADLTLMEDWANEQVVVRTDQTDMFIVWRNLIGNAIKYSKGPGQIHICAGLVEADDAKIIIRSTLPPQYRDEYLPGVRPGKWAVGLVRDSGRGISETDQVHIFTRFYRGEAALTNIPGSGLGLSLVKELLDDYGGHIALFSHFGQGSTFVFWLPAVEL